MTLANGHFSDLPGVNEMETTLADDPFNDLPGVNEVETTLANGIY